MSSDLDDLVMAAAKGADGDIYGLFLYDLRSVALIKGQGKVPHTDGMPPENKRIEVSASINPIDEMGDPRLKQRSMIAQAPEFRKFWASAEKCGISHIKELSGRYVKARLVGTGRTFTGRDGNPVEATQFELLAVYKDHEECVAAFHAETGSQPVETAPTTDDQSSGNEAERQVALRFLPSIVKGANGDLVALETTLASMSPINKYFTVDSPEVQALLRGQS